MSTQKGFRKFQLKVMGFIAVFIGPVVLISTMLVHRLPFPASISETATIANKTSAILPFCLGALALFALSYAIRHAHDWLDRVILSCMFAGFTVVALQMTTSPYVMIDGVGILGLSKAASGALHTVGAVVGFGAMILWVMICFTKSEFPQSLRAPQKHTRNRLYFGLGLAMLFSLSLFIFNFFGFLGYGFPVVFVAEWAMLTFGGIACWLKGGLFLYDKV